MQKSVYRDHKKLSEAVAVLIADWINSHKGELLCFAAGNTPLPVFDKLIEFQEKGELDLSSVDYVGLDEWIGLGYADIGSCKQVMDDSFYLPAQIPENQIMVFDGKHNPVSECAKVEKWINSHQGISLCLLGIGLNGHIGFNEPGYSGINTCEVVKLDQTTKSVSSKYFGQKLDVEYGITISLPTLKRAKRLILMANGDEKRNVVSQLMSERADTDLPAARLLDHPELYIYLDQSAAGE